MPSTDDHSHAFTHAADGRRFSVQPSASHPDQALVASGQAVLYTDDVAQLIDWLQEWLDSDREADQARAAAALAESPLDRTQQQRALALTMARTSVEETSSEGMFTRKGASKISLAGVVSTAHFIVTGDRDYVTTDGEYIERHTDHLPTITVGGQQVKVGRSLPWEETERDGGRSKFEYTGWRSGINDAIGWIEENVSESRVIHLNTGTVPRRAFVRMIRDYFAEPTSPVGPGGVAPISDDELDKLGMGTTPHPGEHDDND